MDILFRLSFYFILNINRLKLILLYINIFKNILLAKSVALSFIIPFIIFFILYNIYNKINLAKIKRLYWYNYGL